MFVCSPFVFFFNMFNVQRSMAIVVALRSNAFFAWRSSFFSFLFSLSHFLALYVKTSCINRFQCLLFSSTFHSFSTFCIVHDVLRYGMAAAAVWLLVISTCMLSLTYLIQTKQFTHRKTHTRTYSILSWKCR